MGCAGPALAGADAGQGGAGSGLWARPSKKRFIIFFQNKFSMRKQFQEKSRSCLKARKILRKSQKFQENSQRHNGTRTIQIKYLELMKKILEPSNK
jgi:hypothetical protein